MPLPPPAAIIQPAVPANPIGCNLDGNVDWATAHIWTDATHAFRTWGMYTKPQDPDPALSFDKNGNPLGDAGVLSYLVNYPNGTYKLTWSGPADAQIVVGGIGRLGPVQRNGKANSADMVLRHEDPNGITGGIIVIQIKGQRAADPVHDLHLYAPGFAPGQPRAGQNFNDDFLRRVRPFACIRFMDWVGTNNSTVARWEDRTTPAFTIQTTHGIAWEYIIDCANQVQRDAWINIPDQATDDYVQHLARLTHDTLDPRLKLRVEYSNEVWNAMFHQFHRTLAVAKANSAITSRDDFGRTAQQYAIRAAQVMSIFQSVYGPDADRVIGVYGGQNSNAYWSDTGLNYLKSHNQAPSQFFKELAIAPYVGNDLGKPPSGGWTLDALFADCEQFTAGPLAAWVRDAKKSADSYNLRLVTYEGGQHLTGNPTVPAPLRVAANDDPRMFTLYHHMHDVWRANSGGGLYQAFSHIGGGWGLLEDINSPGSRKWDAIMDLLLPPGDITLDGKVTWDDFQILQQHYNKPGMWWREQGDLNGDNKVDQRDLDILIANLKDLTPDQKKRVDALRH